MERRRKPTPAHLNPALSLVECSVRASPTLARLIRKSATLEAGGTSAQDALLASAGVRAGEIEALRTQAKRSEDDLRQAHLREAELRRTLEQAATTVAQRDKELKDIRRVLNKTAETQEGSRQSIEAFDRRVAGLLLALAASEEELVRTTAACEEKLARTISTDGLGEQALAVLSMFRDRLIHDEGITEAALGIAGYSPLDVDAAMANQGRPEVRAFQALLARSSWRQRLVLWLLEGTNI
jgi:hypothetical protein